MATGYAGVSNPLFFKENSRMLFGDAKASIEAILSYL
jgi:NAD(P) transhydrogenase subunit beta